MEEDVDKHPAIVQRPIMPHRQNHRVHIELVDHIWDLFSREHVLYPHVREIKDDQHLFYMWHTLPHDMTTLMHHVVGTNVDPKLTILHSY